MTADAEGNLHTPGKGIFETHVTWEDIEHEMQDALKTTATFGPNKKITNIGDGNGFASRICLVEPDWQNVKDGEHLPPKFVAKLCTTLALLALSKRISEEKGIDNFLNLGSVEFFDDKMKLAHNMECHIYYLLNKYNVDKVPRAKIYSARKFSAENILKGMLTMEYVEDLTMVHIFSTLKPEDLHQALRALAAFAALTFKLTEEEKEPFCSNPLSELFAIMFNEESIVSIKQFLEKYDGETYKKEMKELMDILPGLMDTYWFDAIPDQLGMKKVLCHGDLWSTNMLWKKKDRNQSVAAIIDFQTAHFGNPASDLSRFLSTNLSGEDRVNHTEDLLHVYYDFLLEEMGDLPAPYTFEQLTEAYKRYLPVAGFMIVPMFGSSADLFLKKIAEEKRVEAREVLDEKIGTLARDCIELHKRNMALRK